jgi:DNA polymerase-3 subunit alpha
MALIIDVETIGLPNCGSLPFGENPPYNQLNNYESARMVQISMMLCNENLEQVEMFDFIIKTDGFNIGNSHFHGITNVISSERGISFSDVALILSNKLKQVSHIIAHNANFDISIIKSELHRLSLNSIIEEINSKQVLCTMNLTKSIVKATNKYNKIKYPSLSELYKFVFNKNIENAHNSNYDVINLHSSIKQLYNTNVLKFNSQFTYVPIQIVENIPQIQTTSIPVVEQPEKKCPQTTSTLNLNNLKVIELRQKCKECGICKYSKMNKSELINALELINVTSE